MAIRFTGTMGIAALLLTACAMSGSPPARTDIAVQSPFPPLMFTDAPIGGAHPIGGPAKHFIDTANAVLAPIETTLRLHVSGAIHPVDRGLVEPGLVNIPGDFPSIHAAVAAGQSGGGVDAGIGLPNISGQPFGELLVASLPFGMEPDEFAGYLYEGGGLSLQQMLYDEAFDGQVVVLPIALTPTQGGGWFPSPLPDSDSDAALSPERAMAKLCSTPMIVRWPEPGAGVWQAACRAVGIEASTIGPETRCGDPGETCLAPGNPEVNASDALTFGGFVPGGLPHALIRNGNIDAYELNTPYTDVMMIKWVLGQEMVPNVQADLRAVIERAPYYYGSTWHQPLSYVELLIHRDAWNDLSDEQRTAIETAAKAATLSNLAISLEQQDRGLALLEANGAVLLKWPEGLLALLREASAIHLDARADALAAGGDDAYRRALDHQRTYMARHRIYWDLGDINQGEANLKTAPH